jgi:hypothetical protein
MKARKDLQEESLSPIEKAEMYKESLSKSEALEVENVLYEYQIFQNYIADLGRFSSVFLNTEKDDGKIMMVKYYIVTRLKYSNSLYTEMAISTDDYKKIYQIAYPDDAEGKDIVADRDSPLQFLSERDINTDIFMADEIQNPLSSDAIMLTAFIKADTEQQCEEIYGVLKSSFENETQILKELDKDIVCQCVDVSYASEQKNYYDNVEKMVVERLNIVNNALALLKSNYIDKFSDDQRAYYDALKVSSSPTDREGKDSIQTVSEESTENTNVTSHSISYKTIVKFGIIGAIAGCILACTLLLFLYVRSDRIQTEDELSLYGIQKLDTLYYIKNNDIFRQLARKIRGIFPTPIEVQELMLAEDISIMMNVDGEKSLYLLLTCDDSKDAEIAGQMKDLVTKSGFETIIGNPLKAPEELKKLSQTDRVVILAHAKESKRDTIKKVIEICMRYKKTIFGAIVIEVW